jgi:CRP-like cAMP-binding protein
LDLQPGDYLWRQGEKLEVVFLVSEGQIALEIQVPGQGGLEVDLIREGEFLPWLWLGGEYRRRFDARVLLPAKVIALDGKCLRELCDQDHEFGYHLLKRLARATEDRLQTSRVRLMELQSHPATNPRGSR